MTILEQDVKWYRNVLAGYLPKAEREFWEKRLNATEALIKKNERTARQQKEE
jgi:hypothetical protein